MEFCLTLPSTQSAGSWLMETYHPHSSLWNIETYHPHNSLWNMETYHPHSLLWNMETYHPHSLQAHGWWRLTIHTVPFGTSRLTIHTVCKPMAHGDLPSTQSAGPSLWNMDISGHVPSALQRRTWRQCASFCAIIRCMRVLPASGADDTDAKPWLWNYKHLIARYTFFFIKTFQKNLVLSP